jgi:hypothetical protein
MSSAIAGSAQLRSRGTDEPARQRGRQLAVALHRRNAVHAGPRSLARLDHIVEPAFMKVEKKSENGGLLPREVTLNG